MITNYKVYTVVFLMVAGSVTFFSCQRNGKTATTTTEPVANTETPATTPPTTPLDTNLPVPIAPNAPKVTDYSFSLLNQTDGTFGYEVFKSGKLVITQPNIPGRTGNSGFANKEQAAAAANLVIEKLEQGINPPTISEKELKKILK